ncbi:hypothetical protein I6A84_10170 [Frankia sp. CNm7]|uniref:Galactose oxidase n=1 Tax=Frankia nepalensis TaxID=1836974 RepID=A0A937RFC2_9ACTN|nr:hypothetical protein [Frankia nepalensis]MBL7495682.1 hypothetical protein [Frankia nepalensis]MBL7510252.1 hypothetical protein [Frankia nepalensis]MBL7518466.1 hypothetical protein [Frankia nepalensis]MBL7631161.1 hypothetical protein [Frankia nepalensis]
MMNDNQLTDLLHQVADRVPANARLADLVAARVRRARQRRRAAAVAGAASAVVAFVAAAVLFAGSARDDTAPRPEPAATGVDAWRWRDLPAAVLPTDDGTRRLLAVGDALVSLTWEGSRWSAAVSKPAGAPFGPRVPAPDTRRTRMAVAVSDTTVYLWGGSILGSTHGGAHEAGNDLAFDTTTGTWSTLPPAPIQSRDGAAVVWAGGRLVVWGGWRGGFPPVESRTLIDGAAYDPATGTWTVLPTAPAADGLKPSYAAAIDGRVVILVNREGRSSNSADRRTLVYDLAARRWIEAPGSPLPELGGGTGLAATSAGLVVVSATLDSAYQQLNAAARFDLATGTWISLPGPRLRPETLCRTQIVPLRDVATGRTVAAAVPNCPDPEPQVLDPATDAWVPLDEWGADKVLAGVPSSDGAYLTSDALPAGSRPSGTSPRILAP